MRLELFSIMSLLDLWDFFHRKSSPFVKETHFTEEQSFEMPQREAKVWQSNQLRGLVLAEFRTVFRQNFSASPNSFEECYPG